MNDTTAPEFHEYNLLNFEEGVQHISFIHKEKDDNGILRTVKDGTTNEEVLKMLIHRIGCLNVVMPCRENSLAITKIEEALMWLQKRTADRVARNVEGTPLK